MINIQNVTRQFTQGVHTYTALNDVSLNVSQGSFNVLAGPSGSGKTTLLNLIGGMDQPTTGQVLVDGQAIHELDEKGLAVYRRGSVGFIFQGNNLVDSLTVFENILLPLQLNGSSDFSAAESMLGRVGLSDKRDLFPVMLSGGEQQRVAVARALIHSPHIVLADEPTANLDSATGETVVQLLHDLHQELNISIIMATHDPRIIDKAERVIQLVDGKVQ